jgi:hypothetical protein
MQRLIIFILLFSPSIVFSQQFINKTKSQVKLEMSKSFGGKEYSLTIISETDSSLAIKIKNKIADSTDHIFIFDKTGKCSSEKTVSKCDSCLQKLLQKILAQKKYGWKKMNMNQYIADFSAGVFLETQAKDDSYWFTIFRIKLSRKMYDLFLKNK